MSTVTELLQEMETEYSEACRMLSALKQLDIDVMQYSANILYVNNFKSWDDAKVVLDREFPGHTFKHSYRSNISDKDLMALWIGLPSIPDLTLAVYLEDWNDMPVCMMPDDK